MAVKSLYGLRAQTESAMACTGKSASPALATPAVAARLSVTNFMVKRIY